jgi:hypothetical protein
MTANEAATAALSTALNHALAHSATLKGAPVTVLALAGDPQTGGLVCTANPGEVVPERATALAAVSFLGELPPEHLDFLAWQASQKGAGQDALKKAPLGSTVLFPAGTFVVSNKMFQDPDDTPPLCRVSGFAAFGTGRGSRVMMLVDDLGAMVGDFNATADDLDVVTVSGFTTSYYYTDAIQAVRELRRRGCVAGTYPAENGMGYNIVVKHGTPGDAIQETVGALSPYPVQEMGE